jgi:uncharacterized membrane protein
MSDWTAQDKHPPFYYAVLHGWVAIFGNAEWSLRAPSAIAGALSVALLAMVGGRAAGLVLAVVAGVLFAAHPTAVEFSQEARMYPLAGLLALAASVALASSIDRPMPWRFGLYALLAVALIYTHYSGFFVLAVHAGLLAAYGLRAMLNGRGVGTALGGLAACCAVAVAYIPWYGHLLESTRSGVDHLPDPSWTLADVVFASQFGLQRAEDFWLAIALPLVGLGLWGVVKRIANPYVTCVAAIALVPVAQLAYSIVRTPVFDPRQTSPYIAGAVLVLAVGIIEAGAYLGDAFSQKRLALPVVGAATAVLAGLSLVASGDWYQRGPREDWRAAAAEVDVSEQGVYVWRGYIDVPLRYYTQARAEALPPVASPTTRASRSFGILLLSHESVADRQAILTGLMPFYFVGQPRDFVGITFYPLKWRGVE